MCMFNINTYHIYLLIFVFSYVDVLTIKPELIYFVSFFFWYMYQIYKHSTFGCRTEDNVDVSFKK